MLPKPKSKQLNISLKNKEVKYVLTKRGYSIIKEHLSIYELEQLKKDLLVKPYVNEEYGAAPEAYPIYLESEKKLFIPKHIGFKRFGEPDKIKLTKGNFKIDDFGIRKLVDD